MTDRSPPVFLQRELYRARRLADAARLLPILGACLFALPLLWRGEGGEVSTSRAMLYLFAVWALLILAAALLSRRLGDIRERHGDGAEPD
ncbi:MULTISPECIES: hypothetical protein [unclassified Rhodosalinus]|uniref:hypothetical protein n=1 Tax=unclassified Rhodosalinus TaxID=2630183 RepID=UPI0035249F0C